MSFQALRSLARALAPAVAALAFVASCAGSAVDDVGLTPRRPGGEAANLPAPRLKGEAPPRRAPGEGLPSAGPVEADPEEAATETLPTGPTGTLRGQVLDSLGQPYGFIQVSAGGRTTRSAPKMSPPPDTAVGWLSETTPPRETLQPAGVASNGAPAGASLGGAAPARPGEFLLENVPAGTATLTLSMGGVEQASRTVTVEADKTVDVQVRLTELEDLPRIVFQFSCVNFGVRVHQDRVPEILRPPVGLEDPRPPASLVRISKPTAYLQFHPDESYGRPFTLKDAVVKYEVRNLTDVEGWRSGTRQEAAIAVLGLEPRRREIVPFGEHSIIGWCGNRPEERLEVHDAFTVSLTPALVMAAARAYAESEDAGELVVTFQLRDTLGRNVLVGLSAGGGPLLTYGRSDQVHVTSLSISTRVGVARVRKAQASPSASPKAQASPSASPKR